MVKGRVILDSVQPVRERLGEAFLAKVIAKLDEPYQKLIDAGLSQSDWYPLDLLTQFFETEVQMMGLDDGVFQKFAEEATYRQLSGTYRALLREDPEVSVRRFTAVQHTYFKNVAASLVSIESNAAVLRFEGFEKRHRLVQPIIAGFWRRSLHMGGATNPRAEFVVPVGDPSGHADLRITWE